MKLRQQILKILALFVLLILPSCSYQYKTSKSQVTLNEKIKNPQKLSKGIMLSIPSWTASDKEEQISLIDNSNFGATIKDKNVVEAIKQHMKSSIQVDLFPTSGNAQLSRVARAELRKNFNQDKIFRLFNSDNTKEYNIKVECTEYVPDISKVKDKTKLPTFEAGTILMASSAILKSTSTKIPIAGALIQNFGVITGAVTTDVKNDITGYVNIEYGLYGSNGILIESKSFPASFMLKSIENGATSFNELKHVQTSSVADAIIVSTEAAYNHFKKSIILDKKAKLKK